MKIIEAQLIDKSFNHKQVLKSVNFIMNVGEFVAIVGESGSGKSTFAKILHSMLLPDNGKLKLIGQEASSLSRKHRHRIVQMVLQNPYSAFDPLLSIEKSLLEVMQANYSSYNKKQALQYINQELQKYGLDSIDITKNGSQFSGGQLQRLGILRAMLIKPQLLIADEVISALDNHLKIMILDILKILQINENLSILFITHNISSIQHYADKIYVFKDGQIIESGPTQQILHNPINSYTKNLINALPRLKTYK